MCLRAIVYLGCALSNAPSLVGEFPLARNILAGSSETRVNLWPTLTATGFPRSSEKRDEPAWTVVVPNLARRVAKYAGLRSIGDINSFGIRHEI